jgi:hypothetical protein
VSELREAARRALAGRPAGPEPGRVERASLEVIAEGRSELVTVALRDGRLLCVASDGREDGPHVSVALRLLAGLEGAPASPARAPEPDAQEPPPAPRPGERDLEDVVTAIARVGVDAAASAPSVTDALERLVEGARRGGPPPLGLARWVGRLREALARKDLELTARLLEGAARVAADLRAGPGSAEARARLRAWWGPDVEPAPSGERPPAPPAPRLDFEAARGAPADLGPEGPRGATLHEVTPEPIALLVERRLVEIGREHLAGLTRAEIQRRYIVDLESGAVYREDRRRDAPASIGPCPRTLHVGLGRALRGAPPATVQLLQYEVTPEVDADAWLRLEGHAERDFAALAERYRRAQRSFPGQAEPFALIAPARCDFRRGVALEDAEGHVLPLARLEDPAAAEVLDAYEDRPPPTWVAGRLIDTQGALALVPVAAAWGSGQATEHLRLR